MALITCKNCGNQISNQTKNCIHCGHPVKEEEKIYCKECNNEIPKETKQCPFCGIKIKKLKFILPITIILTIIEIIIAIPLIGFTTNDDYFYKTTSYFEEYLFTGLALIFINIIIAIFSIILMTKLIKNKEHIIKKILLSICIVITLISSTIYLNKFSYATYLNYDISIKTLINNGYTIEESKEIAKELHDIMFANIERNYYVKYDKYINIVEINDTPNDNYKEFVLTEAYEAYSPSSFSLYVLITNNKIKNIYWNFNDSIKIYFYENYQKNTNIDYYTKVYANYYIDDFNYILNKSIQNDIKSVLKAPSTATIYPPRLSYNSNSDTFYYTVDVDSQNSFGAMIRGSYRVDLKDSNDSILNYTIRALN